jgi:hypothetical protein
MDFCPAAQNLRTPDVHIAAKTSAADRPPDDADRGFPVPHVSHHRQRLFAPETPAAPARAEEYLMPRDAVGLLELMGVLGALRNDPRAWRLELLKGLIETLPAAGAAAFVLSGVNGREAPAVVSQFEAGFRYEPQREAFVREFGVAAFGDPFSRIVLQRFVVSC